MPTSETGARSMGQTGRHDRPGDYHPGILDTAARASAGLTTQE